MEMETTVASAAPGEKALRKLAGRAAMLLYSDKRSFDRLYGIAYGMTISAGVEEPPYTPPPSEGARA